MVKPVYFILLAYAVEAHELNNLNFFAISGLRFILAPACLLTSQWNRLIGQVSVKCWVMVSLVVVEAHVNNSDFVF